MLRPLTHEIRQKLERSGVNKSVINNSIPSNFRNLPKLVYSSLYSLSILCPTLSCGRMLRYSFGLIWGVPHAKLLGLAERKPMVAPCAPGEVVMPSSQAASNAQDLLLA